MPQKGVVRAQRLKGGEGAKKRLPRGTQMRNIKGPLFLRKNSQITVQYGKRRNSEERTEKRRGENIHREAPSALPPVSGYQYHFCEPSSEKPGVRRSKKNHSDA